ncbi:MAG: hypothetical protein IPJ78_16830 [Gemmatimonadetes bacterium]|nr:hypothetical protein [Gemmatimonadota bacterium]
MTARGPAGECREPPKKVVDMRLLPARSPTEYRKHHVQVGMGMATDSVEAGYGSADDRPVAGIPRPAAASAWLLAHIHSARHGRGTLRIVSATDARLMEDSSPEERGRFLQIA